MATGRGTAAGPLRYTGSRAASLRATPATTNELLYNPATAQQFLPGQAIPGLSALDVLNAPGPFKGGSQFIGGIHKDTRTTTAAEGKGLVAGWAPQIGHITTSAETAKRRKTNPLAAMPVAPKSKNPFVISQTPGAELFGLNIPV